MKENSGRFKSGKDSNKFKHGLWNTPEHRTWQSMIYRCKDDPSIREYPYYAGRGIKVCDEWKSSFIAFLDHMGPKPSPLHSIDRINNEGNYEPGNCRWATRKVQQNNTRYNHLFTWRGESHTLVEWSAILGIGLPTLGCRIRRHKWTVDRAFTEVPVVGKNQWTRDK